jgi:hypothetical protein
LVKQNQCTLTIAVRTIWVRLVTWEIMFP